MKTNRIYIRPDRLNVPTQPCYVGRLSSAVFTLCGNIPDDLTSMNVEIERTPDPTTREPRANLSAACHKQPNGDWRCYLSPFYFPDLAENLRYHVVAQDESENPRWLGSGALAVRENPANGSSVVPPVIPRDAYAYNPVTQLYHKITASVDSKGRIRIEVEQEGIQR